MVSPAGELPLNEAACTLCGQCVLVCPTGALSEVDSTGAVWEALGDPNKHVVVQTAPAIRVALGEEFGEAPGSIVTGQMVAALRTLGFDKVFDTNFTADLTILEEGNELLHRLSEGGKLPMITSCSPGWIKFIEHFYPDMLDHLSTCKSPDPPFSMARPMIRIGIITSGMTININTPAAKMPTSGFQAEYCRLRRISA